MKPHGTTESIDWPRPPRRRGRQVFIILVVFVGIVFGCQIAFSYYVDTLWFGSLGYGAVFWKKQGIQWTAFAAFATTTFLILYGSFLALKRAHLAELRSGQTIFIGQREVRLPVEPVLRFIAIGVSLAIAAITGAGLMAEWRTLALYWYAPHATGGVVDPIFGKPLNFYLFTLPAWQVLLGWLLTLTLIIGAVAIFFLLITGGARMLAGRLSRHVTLPWRSFSIAFGFLLLILAAYAYISR